MSNWFKLFEGDLDETRMRFAISKCPEVWSVWTAILIECCKHRSGEFSWGNQEQELFGFSDKLKIPIAKITECVSLLCDIKYCDLMEGKMKVLKWEEKQDDYLARKSRGYWDKRREDKKLTVNHSESHLEERRGDEIKEEIAPSGAEMAQAGERVSKPRKVSPEAWSLLKWWEKTFPEYRSGEVYVDNGAKDQIAAEKMLRYHKQEELREMIVKAWQNPELFNCKQAVTIAGFSSRINEIKVEIKDKTSKNYNNI